MLKSIGQARKSSNLKLNFMRGYLAFESWKEKHQHKQSKEPEIHWNLSLSADILAGTECCWGCPTQWRMLSCIPGLCPLDASDTFPVVRTKNVSWHWQMSSEGAYLVETIYFEDSYSLRRLTPYPSRPSRTQVSTVLWSSCLNSRWQAKGASTTMSSQP